MDEQRVRHHRGRASHYLTVAVVSVLSFALTMWSISLATDLWRSWR